MSTFAVFGVTHDVALAEAKKRTKGTRKNVKAPGGVEPIPLSEWLELVEKKADQIMGGTSHQLSPLFDAPQYAEQFIELARKTLRCRDMRIKAKAVLVMPRASRSSTRRRRRQRLGFRSGRRGRGLGSLLVFI